MLDARINDSDSVSLNLLSSFEDQDNGEELPQPQERSGLRSEQEFRPRAGEIYRLYERDYQRRFKWLRPGLFDEALAKDLAKDAADLIKILQTCGQWDSVNDLKLNALYELLIKKHPGVKILVFTQFTDTVEYLTEQLKFRGLTQIEGATGQSADPTQLAWRFSPQSNEKTDEWNLARRHNASLYDAGLEDLPVKRPVEAPYAYHVYHLYVIVVEDRDALRTYLTEKGIVNLIHYPTPIHLQKVYRGLGYGPGSFPAAERSARQIISLPLYPSLKDDEIAYVCRVISEFYGK